MKEHIIRFITNRYNATIAEDSTCENYLEQWKHLIVGFSFSDPCQNFTLMTEGDFLAFPPEQSKQYITMGISPFSNVILIFYTSNDGVSFKIVNGMASRLFQEITVFLEKYKEGA